MISGFAEKGKGRRIIPSLLLAVCLLLQPVQSFAVDKDDIESYLSDFKPKEVQGQAYEEITDKYKLKVTNKEKGGITEFDVAKNGNIAVITGERGYLSIYDSNMSVINKYGSGYYMIGVRYLDDSLLVFGYEECAVYDAACELVAVYKLTEETEGPFSDTNIDTKYHDMARENIKKRGDDIYYISNRKSKAPTNLGDRKNTYNYLIKVDKAGNRTVLLNRALYRRTRILLFLLSSEAAYGFNTPGLAPGSPSCL